MKYKLQTRGGDAGIDWKDVPRGDHSDKVAFMQVAMMRELYLDKEFRVVMTNPRRMVVSTALFCLAIVAFGYLLGRVYLT